jgi:hypothetical protein
MFLGSYRYDGDPDELLRAYDRLMSGMPVEQLTFHMCIRRDDGITIYDTCPSEEAFESFSTDPAVRSAMAAAGLPEPLVTPLGESHNALAAAEYTTASPD